MLAERVKPVLLVLIVLCLLGTVVLATFDGHWLSSYVVKQGSNERRYFLNLDRSPLWSQPEVPSFTEFSESFNNGDRPFPSGGTIHVYREWGVWLLSIMMIWLIGFLVITPVCFVFFRRDRVLGAFGRFGVALIGAALTCFLLWLAFGGWGPPAPLFFGTVGVLVGAIWAGTYFGSRSGPDSIGKSSTVVQSDL